jgi:hypothetical protein
MLKAGTGATVRAPEHHQTRSLAFGGGHKGDQLAGKLICIVICFHAGFIAAISMLGF